MISKSKMFIIAENVDDSIKSQTSSYDITIFKSFVAFERYVNETPVVLDTLVVSARELPFNGTNMARILKILNSPFLKMQGNVLYLIDKTVKYEAVNKFLEMYDIKGWAVFQGDINIKFITDIVTGTGRVQTEGQSEVITYRIRSSEYIKQKNQLKYENNESKYFTDEEELEGVPYEDETAEIASAEELYTRIHYVVGEYGYERTVMVFLLGQYLSMSRKTLIVEKDVEYHMLMEMVTKSGIDYELVSIDELINDISSAISKIRGTLKNLVIIGEKDKRKYNYNFLMDLLESNLEGEIPYVIRECDFTEAPYGKNYTIAMGNTVPDIIKGCNQITRGIEVEKVTFIGVQLSNLGPVNITSSEMKSIVEVLLGVKGVAAQIVHVNNIRLKGDEVVYDILGILNRGN